MVPSGPLIRFSALIVAAALSMLPSDPAAAADCALPGLRAEVTLTEKRGRQKFSNGFSGRQLESRRRQAGGAPSPGPEWHPVGLMGRDLSWELKVAAQGRRHERGYCVGIKKADLIIGYDKITVYVDRQYRPGSCQYAVIVEHEQQHVQNFKVNLAAYIPHIRQKLNDEVRRLTPRTASSVRAGADHFVQQLRRRLAPLIQRMQSDMERDDRLIDTPENYRSIQARCDNW